MAKITILLFLTVYLTLQLTTAYPQRNGVATEEPNFIKSLEPVVLTTLDVVDKYFETLITQTAHFVEDVLVELKALPEKNDYIRELIPQLTGLLECLGQANKSNRASIISEIGKLYEDFDNILKANDDSNKTKVLKSVLKTLHLLELNWSIENSVSSAVRKFTEAYEPFWNSLSDEQKREHKRLSDWYDEFKAGKTSQDKLKGFEEFLRIALDVAGKDSS
ncbi:uncharacterized protein LOC101460366 [Ceratitis capitata]|uniref:Uncharacterized protein n=1 Tax=Ceratitis capitata TaxID=7213 RepID=W8CBC0_CERCA|nr:uncharacterized protein LOC101460366 [Ceratitis capitata]